MIKIYQAAKNDDFLKIIKLIYQTDPFIYSAMCNNDYSYFEQIMQDFLMQESMFSYKNIVLAKDNKTIVGLLLSFTKNHKLPSFIHPQKIEIRKCLTYTLNDYFAALLDKLEPNTLYINNLCVDENYRNKGIGYLLLDDIIKKSKEPKIVLDCLEDNKSAVNLYKKNNFEIGKTFDGYTGNKSEKVRCLEFVYDKENK